MCDAVPMDACHLLFRRPWLYDQRMLYHNFKNTCLFIKDGIKITLVPCKKEN